MGAMMVYELATNPSIARRYCVSLSMCLNYDLVTNPLFAWWYCVSISMCLKYDLVTDPSIAQWYSVSRPMFFWKAWINGRCVIDSHCTMSNLEEQPPKSIHLNAWLLKQHALCISVSQTFCKRCNCISLFHRVEALLCHSKGHCWFAFFYYELIYWSAFFWLLIHVAQWQNNEFIPYAKSGFHFCHHHRYKEFTLAILKRLVQRQQFGMSREEIYRLRERANTKWRTLRKGILHIENQRRDDPFSLVHHPSAK